MNTIGTNNSIQSKFYEFTGKLIFSLWIPVQPLHNLSQATRCKEGLMLIQWQTLVVCTSSLCDTQAPGQPGNHTDIDW